MFKIDWQRYEPDARFFQEVYETFRPVYPVVRLSRGLIIDVTYVSETEDAVDRFTIRASGIDLERRVDNIVYGSSMLGLLQPQHFAWGGLGLYLRERKKENRCIEEFVVVIPFQMPEGHQSCIRTKFIDDDGTVWAFGDEDIEGHKDCVSDVDMSRKKYQESLDS